MNSESKTCAICGKENALFENCCNGECFTKYAFHVMEDLTAKHAQLPDQCNAALFHIRYHLQESFKTVEKFSMVVLHDPSYTFRWAENVLLASHKFEFYRLLAYKIGGLQVVDNNSLLRLISMAIDEQQEKLNRASFIECSTSQLSNLTRLYEGVAAVQIISDLRPYIKNLSE